MKTASLCAAILALSAHAALAQFAPGTKVYAAPTGGNKYWYSGCVMGEGHSNNSWQVTCAGTTWWVSADNIRTDAPQPFADPMRPGQMIVPMITPSSPSVPPPRAAAAMPAPRAAAAPAAAAGPGNYAAGMAASIAADNKAAASVSVLKPGKYSCYAGGQYTFTDLIIKSATSYSDSRGNSGSYSIANGALTFTSGPYKGSYSRMVDGHTIGLSAAGSTNLGTQCGFDG